MMLPENKLQLPEVRSIIPLLSGKGGVGKTLVSVCLAIALAKAGNRVGLLDCDVTSPDVLSFFGMTASKITPLDNLMMPLEKYGVKTVSMAALTTRENEPIAWRGPILAKITRHLLRETMWGSLDYLFIDLPSETADITLTILQQVKIEGVILVTTPQKIATSELRRSIQLCNLLEIPPLGLIENFRGEIFGEGGTHHIAEEYGIPFLGSIPLRKQIAHLADQGIPPILQFEELGIIFNKIGRLLEEKVVGIHE